MRLLYFQCCYCPNILVLLQIALSTQAMKSNCQKTAHAGTDLNHLRFVKPQIHSRHTLLVGSN